jgi:magnesium-transporting ATPase (P-type)
MGTINWKAGIWAGIIAGIIFLILEMIMVPLFLGGSPWGPPRMIAAIVLGEGVLPPPATFNFGIVMVAIVLHMILSVIYALIIGYIIRKMSFGMALSIGALIGLALYLVNFFVMTGIFPWFEMARNWVSIFAHLIFGLSAAWVYIKHREHSPEKDRILST